MLHPFRTGILILSCAVLLLSGVAFAAPNQSKTNKAVVTVEVKNSADADAVNLSKMYVVMYNAILINNEWWGKKTQVKKIPAGKKTVTFNVKPGQVVDFKVFETFGDVNTNKKRQFYSPPFKNFADINDAGKLCMVNGVDFSEKFPDLPCTNEFKLVYSGSDAKVSVEVNDGIDDSKPFSNVAVGMYNVAIVNNEWWGELVQVKPIPAGKTQAFFSVTPGQIVDFLAFKNEAEAKKVKKHQFIVPPKENFSDQDGIAQLCVIAGIDVAKKLEIDDEGTTSCSNEIGLTLEK